MSRVRKLASIVLLAASVSSIAAACSKDDDDAAAPKNDRGAISFGDAPEGSQDLGLCGAYDVAQMKEIIGGGPAFRRLAPTAIGQEGDAVTGEGCSWERVEANGDTLSLSIEVRNFGDDVAGATARFDELQQDAVAVDAVPGMGDAAFASVADGSSVLQARRGGYLLTLASRSAGELEPLSTDTLTLLGTAGLERLP